jgi:hypothetical protein
MPLGCNAGCLAPSFREAHPLRAGVIFSLRVVAGSGHDRVGGSASLRGELAAGGGDTPSLGLSAPGVDPKL